MRLFAAGSLSLLLGSLVAQAPADALFDPQQLARVATLLQGEVAAGRHAGLSFVLQHGGREVASGAFGKADIATGRPLRADSIVRVYSMSKPVTAIAALVLVEQGKLRLDQPIAEFLPELKAPKVFTGGTAEAPELTAAATAITVRMLCNHTAGFTYDFFRESPLHEIYRKADLWAATSSEDFLRRAAALPLLAQPGTAWNYSIADDVLGVLIERVAQQGLAEFVREQVTGPLGMVDTDFDVEPQKRDRLATLHTTERGRLVTMEPSFGVYAEAGRGFAAGGAGLFSTLHDFARFARFLIGDGTLDGVRVLGRKTMELARTNSLGAGQRISRPADGWGLFSAVCVDPGAGTDPFSPGTLHWSGAATTTFFADPKEDVVAVLFGQHLPFDEHKVLVRFRTAVYQAMR
jgi:CubicO group peptidase (beta-lactamase class C family)